MSKIICSNPNCKYCNDNYKCTNKQVELSYCYIDTCFHGTQEYLKCKSYEERDDEWYKNAKELVKKVIENG